MEDFESGAGLDKHKRHAERLLKQPSNISAHLVFNGNCREAMAFYADVLCGEVTQMFTHGEMPDNTEVVEEWRDKIIHAEVNLGGRILMGADAPPGFYEKPTGVSVQLEYQDAGRGKDVFDRLVQGGSAYMPFGETSWAKGFGMLTDRFGTHWMINADRFEM
jgi:PhnB protein